MDMAMAPQLLPHTRRCLLLLPEYPVEAHLNISKNLQNQSENKNSPRPDDPAGPEFEAVARDDDGGGGGGAAPVLLKWAIEAGVDLRRRRRGVECAI